MKAIITLLLVCYTAIVSAIAAPSPVGQWLSIDDETGKPRSILAIDQNQAGQLSATVQQVVPINGKQPRKYCDACSGERHNQPIVGMTVVWGMQRQSADNQWSQGYILDPKSGRVYRCNMALNKAGDRLKVRGYIGFALLGRTQVWERANG